MNDSDRPAGLLNNDLNSALGIELGAVEDGRVRGHFEVTDRVRQPFGIVHGGAYAALAETLASVGTYAAVAEGDKIAMGMNNDTSFLRAVSDGQISGEARAIHRGSTTWVWEIEMRDQSQRLCAVSRLTIAVRARRA